MITIQNYHNGTSTAETISMTRWAISSETELPIGKSIPRVSNVVHFFNIN